MSEFSQKIDAVSIGILFIFLLGCLVGAWAFSLFNKI